MLELCLDDDPDEATLDRVASAAHALAYIVIANRRFTDLYEWGQRSRPLSLEAEIQHRLLPGSYTCEAGQFTLAGWLEPAGDVGGDTFDFSLERDTLHLSMTDAMGHTLDAAMLATVLVGALRNARRRGVGLADQARLADEALSRYARDGAFVTGQLVRVDLHSGHGAASSTRDIPRRYGSATAMPSRSHLHADPPFAAPTADGYVVQELALEAGDRLVFLTDGMLERNATDVDVLSVLDGLPAPTSARGRPGADASGRPGVRGRAARRRNGPVPRLARRAPAGPRRERRRRQMSSRPRGRRKAPGPRVVTPRVSAGANRGGARAQLGGRDADDP